MPEIMRFEGFKVQMFFEDHAPAHVHVQGGGHKAKLRISDGSLIGGDLPSRARNAIAEWVVENQAALLARWKRYGGA